MKKLIPLYLLCASSLFAQDKGTTEDTTKVLSSGTIRKAYYSSYELENQERYKAASSALDPIAQVYPQGYTLNYRRGWLSYRNGNYADARKFYQVALTQFPSSLEVRKAMTLLEVARKAWKEVEQQARIGRSIDYYNLDFIYWQSYALRMQGQSTSAIKILEEITLLYPTKTNFLMELAYNYYAIKKKIKVETLLETVFILDPYNQDATALSALIYKK